VGLGASDWAHDPPSSVLGLGAPNCADDPPSPISMVGLGAPNWVYDPPLAQWWGWGLQTGATASVLGLGAPSPKCSLRGGSRPLPHARPITVNKAPSRSRRRLRLSFARRVPEPRHDLLPEDPLGTGVCRGVPTAPQAPSTA